MSEQTVGNSKWAIETASAEGRSLTVGVQLQAFSNMIGLSEQLLKDTQVHCVPAHTVSLELSTPLFALNNCELFVAAGDTKSVELRVS